MRRMNQLSTAGLVTLFDVTGATDDLSTAEPVALFDVSSTLIHAICAKPKYS